MTVAAHTQSTGKRLPEWGYQQYEVSQTFYQQVGNPSPLILLLPLLSPSQVVTDRAVEGSQVWWVMEELKAPAAMSRNTTREKEEEELKKRRELCLAQSRFSLLTSSPFCPSSFFPSFSSSSFLSLHPHHCSHQGKERENGDKQLNNNALILGEVCGDAGEGSRTT